MEPQSNEPALPKLLVVAGLDAADGPSHNLLDINAEVEASTHTYTSASGATPSTPGKGGFWDDATENLGIPYPSQIKAGFSNILKRFTTL